MLSSTQDFFANSDGSKVATPEGTRDKKRVKKSMLFDDDDNVMDVGNTGGADGILALLDEIDAINSQCPTTIGQVHVSNPFGMASTYNGDMAGARSIPSVDKDTMTSLKGTQDSVKVVENRLYLPHPFTAEAMTMNVLELNARELGKLIDHEINEHIIDYKLKHLHGFVKTWEQIGVNYLISLTPGDIECTVEGSVFSDDPCHVGMFMICENVTVIMHAGRPKHGIICAENVIQLYCNHHEC